jgi:hypothetical protein
MNKLTIIILALVIVIGLVFVVVTSKPKVVLPPVAGNPLPPASLPQVTSPLPNQEISSPLEVIGSAPGGWFFEASLPVSLLDANGKQIAIAPAQAEGEWMTPKNVPFRTTLTFDLPTTATGTLIVAKDNPSGLPENDQQFLIPIRFSQATSTTL